MLRQGRSPDTKGQGVRVAKFLRKKKSDKPAAESQPGGKRAESRRALPRFILLAGCAGALGVLLTFFLLQLLLIAPYLEQTERQQQQQNLATATGIVNHLQDQLQRQTQALAASRPVAESLITRNTALQAQLADSATSAIGGAQQVRIRTIGDHQPDRSGKVPMNFASIDLQRRVERGQSATPEFSKNGEHWTLQSAAPIRSGSRIIGTLLIQYDPQVLSQPLSAVPVAQGRLELLQQFSGSPQQTVLSQGQGSGEARSEPTRNPLWTLRFTPTSSLFGDGPDPLLTTAALVAGLLVVLLGTVLAAQRQYRAYRDDAARLLDFIKNRLAGQTPDAPVFHVAPFRNLALTLAELLQSVPRKNASTPRQERADAPERAQAPAAEVDPQVSRGSLPPLPDILEASDDFSAPLFQDEDILELDDDLDDLLIEEEPTTSGAADLPPREIFRAYDIRGIVGQTLTEGGVTQIGRAIAAELLEQGQSRVVVGMDGRLSSPALKQCLLQGLTQSGIDVIDIGQVPTPVLYFATVELQCPNGVMITGSHNPAEYNGLKIMIDGQTLAQKQILALHQRLQEQRLHNGNGSVQDARINSQYQERILEDVVLARPMKVVVDCGNGVAGPAVSALYNDLGCEVIELYCDVDGQFPNHHPDPSKPANLEELIARVQHEDADLGLAFDGDGDRVGLVTNRGQIVWPDRLLMLLARDVVTRNPGADILFDVKCTRKLNALISGHGGRPVMCQTGHSLVKAKMQETGALLAGEMSGHIFFKERWYGFDDGIYSGARLLEVLSADLRPVDEQFADFPEGHCTPEINIPVEESRKFAIIQRLAQEGDFTAGSLIDIDGLRVEYPDGWGLIRASNTTPVLVLRFEADSDEALLRLKHLFKQQLLKVAPDLDASF